MIAIVGLRAKEKIFSTNIANHAPLGSHVHLRGSTDVWSVLYVGEHTVKVMRDDRLNPTTVEMKKKTNF